MDCTEPITTMTKPLRTRSTKTACLLELLSSTTSTMLPGRTIWASWSILVEVKRASLIRSPQVSKSSERLCRDKWPLFIVNSRYLLAPAVGNKADITWAGQASTIIDTKNALAERNTTGFWRILSVRRYHARQWNNQDDQLWPRRELLHHPCSSCCCCARLFEWQLLWKIWASRYSNICYNRSHQEVWDCDGSCRRFSYLEWTFG